MAILEEFLEHFGIESEEPEEESREVSIIEMTELEIDAVMQELAMEHVDTDKYTTSVNNLKTLSESLEKMAKAKAAMAEADSPGKSDDRKVNWDIVIPKVAVIAAYTCGTAFIVMVEREHPVPMRLVQWTNNLLMPRV